MTSEAELKVLVFLMKINRNFFFCLSERAERRNYVR